ncbi:serine protease 53-like [Portunus trituberculatus]|uniref:serine protease 53-like n=1 Tax=Portunus trituberculatus TaxID=210409 RepID=UPI001E1CD7BC|nr:serine protease 53-like [Portunus trituberculatus]
MKVPVLFMVVVSLGVTGPKVEGTFSWFTSSPDLPSLTLPDICGARVFVSENETTIPRATNTTTNETNMTDGTINGTTVSPVDQQDGRPAVLTDTPWPWVVRIGDRAAGVLLSQQHVITLEHCLEDYSLWYGGFSTFPVQVGEGSIVVPRVQAQGSEGGEFPLALLTLESNLTWIPAPVCVGALQDGLLAAAVGWGDEGTLREEPLTLYRRGQCNALYLNYNDDEMVCGGTGPMDCGAPLLQADDGRWMLVGLGVGDESSVARYVRLEPSREWLENV